VLSEHASQWEWVERRNKAAEFPTDFGLLRIADVALTAVKVIAASFVTRSAMCIAQFGKLGQP